MGGWSKNFFVYTSYVDIFEAAVDLFEDLAILGNCIFLLCKLSVLFTKLLLLTEEFLYEGLLSGVENIFFWLLF